MICSFTFIRTFIFHYSSMSRKFPIMKSGLTAEACQHNGCCRQATFHHVSFTCSCWFSLGDFRGGFMKHLISANLLSANQMLGFHLLITVDSEYQRQKVSWNGHQGTDKTNLVCKHACFIIRAFRQKKDLSRNFVQKCSDANRDCVRYFYRLKAKAWSVSDAGKYFK